MITISCCNHIKYIVIIDAIDAQKKYKDEDGWLYCNHVMIILLFS